MASLLLLRASLKTPKQLRIQKRSCRWYTIDSQVRRPKDFKPLQILFCGSDEFSIASLKDLNELSKARPDIIKSIDVLCRPPKRTGRGLKILQQVPIFDAAKKLKLPIHQADNFLDWELPRDGAINLIVAVSFGLFIPPRLIHAAEYGGLNVHPSILPNFRGSAPLQKTIMFGAKRTGISVQTLDERKFDHGVILAQKRLRIAGPNTIEYQSLLDFVTPHAAELLTHSIKEGLFVPPLIDVSKDTYESSLPPDKLVNATRITKEDRHINWFRYDSLVRIDRRHRALGALYSMIYESKDEAKRFIFHELEMVDRPIAIHNMVHQLKNHYIESGWYMEPHSYKFKEEFASRPESQVAQDGSDDEVKLAAWVRSRGPEDLDNKTDDENYEDWLKYEEQHHVKDGRSVPNTPFVEYFVAEASSGDKVPVFYIREGQDIIVAVRDGAFRVKHITVEGESKKPAAVVMKNNRSRTLWKLRIQNVGGIERWSALWAGERSARQKSGQWDPEYAKRHRRPNENLLQAIESREYPITHEESSKYRPDSKKTKPIFSRKVRKGEMGKAIMRIKEKNRAERIKLDELKKARHDLIQELKAKDWSDALSDKEGTLFPGAFEKAREMRLQERKQKRLERLDMAIDEGGERSQEDGHRVTERVEERSDKVEI